MRKLSAFLLILILILSLCIPALAARPVIITPATGYQDADDVQYKTYSQSGKTVIANWGARGETCTFLSSYAETYYTGSYTWDSMSQTSGGTTIGNAYNSALYRQLKTLMSSTHSFYTYYDGNKNVRDYYKYTDCVRNDTSKVSLFYFGTMVSSTWNQGTIWNQEHVWPKSKLSNSQQIGDIMHLRPADPDENTYRSNTAYGESGGYYDPGLGVRGDCARMMLYMYVRWGATSTMWGTSGVMESLTILLKWMEEDPVDTWEMGRNDSVQSITGTRNVFVDYPEYAWLLFGKEIPENMDTPSGNAGTKCRHQNTEVRGKTYADCTLSGYTGDTYCLDCGECIATGTTSPATGHLNTTTENQVDETCTTDGYTGDVYCYDCDEYISTGTIIPATGHLHTERQNKTEPTCGKDGYTGDVYCLDCQQIIYTGITKPATGNHSFSEWLTRPGGGGKDRVCQVCGHIESQEDPASCTHVSKYTVTVQPTCTAKGYGGNYCEKCNEYLGGGKEIPATGHQHTEIRNKAAASCTSDGYTGDTWCTDCNTKIKTGQSIPAAGHKNTEIRDAKEANCNRDG
jgi:endonuclease I